MNFKCGGGLFGSGQKNALWTSEVSIFPGKSSRREVLLRVACVVWRKIMKMAWGRHCRTIWRGIGGIIELANSRGRHFRYWWITPESCGRSSMSWNWNDIVNLSMSVNGRGWAWLLWLTNNVDDRQDWYCEVWAGVYVYHSKWGSRKIKLRCRDLGTI